MLKLNLLSKLDSLNLTPSIFLKKQPKFTATSMSRFILLFAFILSTISCNSNSKTTIKGHLELEIPGNIKFSQVAVFKNAEKVLDLKLVSPDFKMELDNQSFYTISISSPEHERLETILFTQNSDFDISVTLAKQRHEITQNPYIIGSFNGFNPQQAIALEPIPDGEFQVEVPTNNGEVRYQLMGVTPDLMPVVGTQQDTFGYFNESFFVSVINSSEPKVKIIFKPVVSPSTKITQLKSSDNEVQTVADAYKIISQNRAQLTAAYVQQYMSGSDGLDIDWETMSSTVLEKLAKSTNKTEKAILINAYLDLLLVGYTPDYNADVETAIFEIGALNPAWSINQYAILAAMDHTQNAELKRDFIKEMSTKHKDDNVRMSAIYGGFLLAEELADTSARHFYYDKLLAEFPTSNFVENINYQYNPANKVATGVQAPAFSVRSIDGKSTYDNALFAGKYVLLDFWATWCGPCIEEMDELHSVYADFKSDKFEILSLSFDEAAEKVIGFRKERFPMPWLHTFIDGGFENDLSTRFEITSIPRPILIDPKGKIIATGLQLRGTNLRKTISKLVGK